MSIPNYANLYLTGDSGKVINLLKIELQQPNLKVHTKEPKNYDYLVYVFKPTQRGTNETKKILDELSTNKIPSAKIAIVLLGNQEYYRQVVDVLGNQTLNYRVIQTFDLYHQEGVPIISQFEEEIADSIKSKSINVSFNGARVLYLTEIRDLAKAIIKSLFVGNTKGETFTIIGEPVTDLELAYLLKKVLEKNKTTLNIDLNKTYRDKDADYFDQSVRSQAALNWLPQISIADCLNNIVKNYLKESLSILPQTQVAAAPKVGGTSPVVEEAPRSLRGEGVQEGVLKPLEKIISSNKQKKKKTENIHQTEKRGLAKIAFITAIFLILSVVVPVGITSAGFYLSTKETYESYQSLRRGNIKESQTRLSRAGRLKKITGFTFKMIIWTGNLISPGTTSQANDYLLILQHSQSVLDLAIKSYLLSNHLYSAILGHETLSSNQTAQAIKVNLIALNDNLSEIQLLLN
ncbi:hypothetical protein HYS10_02170, partial [Candidatus Collierbacteria bacterium]|nr:hypothetical protein [Candidatus Collierbacteria bacterium]